MPLMFLCSLLNLSRKILLQVSILLSSTFSTMKCLATSSMLKNLHGKQKKEGGKRVMGQSGLPF